MSFICIWFPYSKWQKQHSLEKQDHVKEENKQKLKPANTKGAKQNPCNFWGFWIQKELLLKDDYQDYWADGSSQLG